MFRAFEQILDALEERRLTRREAVARLGAVAAALAGAGGLSRGQETPGSTFRAVGLNHIALRVTDVGRSRDFYKKHLGLGVLSESDSNCFMSCGRENFVALFAGDEGAMDHYCYSIEGYDPGPVVKTLEGAGLKPRRRENRVYFDDPDGLTVQVASPNHYPTRD
jgi:catechol 2,3-dioxygenase-like lactoylglutathione lyase family enzyme